MKLVFNLFISFCVGWLMFMVSSCSPYRTLREDQYLVHKNKVIINLPATERSAFIQHVPTSDLEDLIKQRPNQRILWYKFNLALYSYGIRKDNKWRRFWQRMGEPPSVLDTALTFRSSKQMTLFLHKKGYFMARVLDSTAYSSRPKKYYSKNKSYTFFKVNPGPLYTIKNLRFSIDDTALVPSIRKASRDTKVKLGNPYDEDVLSSERVRMESEMRNLGYFTFNRQYVYFEIDSNLHEHGVRVKQKIENPQLDFNTPDTSIRINSHRVYSYQKIYVQIEPAPGTESTVFDTTRIGDYYFILPPRSPVRPYIIARSLYINPGEEFSQRDVEYTYNRLSALQMFRQISINVNTNPTNPSGTELIVLIKLTPGTKRNASVQAEGTSRIGNLGVNASLHLGNRNLFRGAEVLSLGVFGGLEAQRTNDELFQSQQAIEGLPFNTLEYGAEGTVRIPDLWIPRNRLKKPRYERPATLFSAGYNRQVRNAYDRDLTQASFGYTWSLHRRHVFTINPLELSVIKIVKSPSFENRLLQTGNSLLINSYRNHFILGGKLQYYYTNKREGVSRNFVELRSTLESAGNSMYLIAGAVNAARDTNGSYLASSVPFAHFIKTDADLRLNSILTAHTNHVYRLYGGLGLTLNNVNVLPFEKSFFGGGANNNRAWILRTMGPGGMADTMPNVDRIGDMKLEFNYEYRFDLIQALEGALFVDAGNIWLLNKDIKRPLAEFNLERFYKELAVGAGFGLRLDLDFFILRLDMAMRMHDPMLPTGERWIWESKKTYEQVWWDNQRRYKRNVNFNFAIQYPF